jgi:UDP-N-acetylmuramoyl-tripeptide--D-alanyl-D-alanine ligase
MFSVAFIRQALSGTAKVFLVHEQNTYKRVHTDSRSVQPGDLFVAIKGDHVDGHDFIKKAIEQGATGVVCEKYPADIHQVDIYLVESSLAAYRLVAGAWRVQCAPQVIGVAGSVGKTTTKDLLSAIMKARYPLTLSTSGSQNGFVGLPMTLLKLKPDSACAVIEIGIDDVGAMAQHIELVQPDLAIVTAISEEHLENLKDLKTIATEENMILKEVANTGGIAIVNLDDPWIAPLFDSLQGPKVGFSLSSTVGLHGAWAAPYLTVSGLGRKAFKVKSPLPGEHNARNLLGAVAVAVALGLTNEEITLGLESFVPSGGRSDIQYLKGGSPVVCDFYNANPASMRAAFHIADGLHSETVHLCLGDMLELGEQEEELHRGLVESLRAMKAAKKIYLYGPRMKWLQDELTKHHIHSEHFEEQTSLANKVIQSLSTGDAILIKGSRSMRMEKVWEIIKNGSSSHHFPSS